MSPTTGSPTQASLHRERIEAAARGRRSETTIENAVLRSWRRCLHKYSLDPGQRKKPHVVDAAELRRRRASMGASYAVVQAEITRLAALLGPTAAGMVFTDLDGVILNCESGREFTLDAHRSGFRLGAVWSESELGTNGMGTCLIEREPLVIARQEHFLAQNVGLTCFAAPVFDRRGQLVGALDISCRDALPQEPMLALLNLAVADIENRLLMRESAGDYLLHFSRRRSYIDTALEGVVSMDANGVITGANRTATLSFGMRMQAQLCGRRIQDLLGIDDGCIELLQSPNSFRCRLATEPEDRPTYHCEIRSPAGLSVQDRQHEPIEVRSAVASAERCAIQRALQRCHWNVTRAARLLGIGRKTLYRKIHKYRLQPSQR